MKEFVGIACVLGMAGVVSAQPLEFETDPAQSSLDLTISIVLDGMGSDSDSDSSALSGFINASFDDPESPSEMSLHDFQAVMDSDLNYNWAPAFLTTADATLVGGMIEYAAGPGVVQGPVPVVGGGFEFLDVPVQIAGVLTVNYNIFLAGSGSEVIDLSTLGISATPISGTHSAADGIATLSNTILLEGSQPLVLNNSEVGQVVFSGTATLVSTALIPDCVADMNGDGELDFLDISAFLSAYGSGDLAADLNGDGELDFLDISAFLGSYTAGCP